MTAPAEPKKSPIRLKRRGSKPEPGLDSLRDRQADKPLDIVGHLTLENLPIGQKDVIAQALKRMEGERYRRYYKREGERAAMENLLADALRAVNEARGWELSPETYDIALFFAALDHQHLDSATRRLHHGAGFVIAAIHDELRQSEHGKDLPELDFILAQSSYLDAMTERKATVHKFTGLYNDPDTVRDRVLTERDRLQSEGDHNEVMLIVEVDFVHFKDLNTAYGNDTVDMEVLIPLGDELRRRFRSHDIRCHINGDEFTFIFTRIVSQDAERMLKHVQQVFEQCQYGETIRKNSIKVRVGGAILQKTDLDQIPATDARKFVSQLRSRALAACKTVKKRNNREGDTNRVALWDATMEGDQEMAWELKADAVRRDNSTAIDDIRSTFGNQAADVFQLGLEQALRDAGKQTR